MWLGRLVLFIALSPGVLFTIPSLGKKMGGKVMIATMHAVLFVIVANLFTLVEGFQMGGSIPMSQTITQRVLSAIGAGSRSLAGNSTYLGQITEGRGPAPPAGQQGGLEVTEVDRKAGEAKVAQVAAEKARAQAAAAEAAAAQARAQARNASLERRAARR